MAAWPLLRGLLWLRGLDGVALAVWPWRRGLGGLAFLGCVALLGCMAFLGCKAFLGCVAFLSYLAFLSCVAFLSCAWPSLAALPCYEAECWLGGLVCVALSA